ncbi:unnamed protein product [Triticum turgidum subsp. durum]|uniref:Uncharacterized protein n=1 Tax=Triticum turgidum subsp. durum TaxID=4567 RepID=A0A9R0Y6H2_TRITD|nr:unnamed protein product [Triticum turgidum subsp. durum]
MHARTARRSPHRWLSPGLSFTVTGVQSRRRSDAIAPHACTRPAPLCLSALVPLVTDRICTSVRGGWRKRGTACRARARVVHSRPAVRRMIRAACSARDLANQSMACSVCAV